MGTQRRAGTQRIHEAAAKFVTNLPEHNSIGNFQLYRIDEAGPFLPSQFPPLDPGIDTHVEQFFDQPALLVIFCIQPVVRPIENAGNGNEARLFHHGQVVHKGVGTLC
ncbi:hypothetical protein [Desulfosarcina alkanivorans]|uniref:hypothetical protein n=1 Tax=Desulfosarcina alkanivorans TaxID=571177 RepID=UPI0012D36501|nr:hypothetical protein [Desulfosarcina alkanivorans]